MNLPSLSVKRPVTVTMIICIVVVIGVISFTRLGLELMPEITYPVISVIVEYPGASPEDIETLITKPLEEVIPTVKNVKKVNSFSQEGLSALLVEFEWGANLDLSAQDIRDRIDHILDFLPEDMERPVVFKFDPSMIPIMAYGITGERNLKSLRSISKDMIKDKLEQVDGISSVMILGGIEDEILVELDRRKLDGYNITMDEIIARLRAENVNLPGGYVKEGYVEYLLRTKGEYSDIDEIKNLPIRFTSKTPIYLKDITNVQQTTKEIRAYVRTNKKSSVMIMVYKESGINTVIVSNRVKKELDNLKKHLPKDIKIHTVLDQSDFIKRIINVTGSNAIVGGLLAVLVLYFFLRNWRPTLAITLNIPLAILATFIPLYFLGQTLNFITMIGIALGVGMLVDNSIVVIENIYRHYKEGEDRITASVDGATEVGMAITASTLTTIVVFLPLIFVKGITGKLFEGLGISISFSLLASLFVSLTIIPMVTSRIFTHQSADGGFTKSDNWERKIIESMKMFYSNMLKKIINNKLKVLGISGICVLLSLVVAIFFIGKEFFPEVDHDMVIARVKMPVGTALDETDRVSNLVEDAFIQQDDVKTVLSKLGLIEGMKADAVMGIGPAGPNEAELFVRLKDKKERKYSAKQINENVRKRFPKFESIELEFINMGKAMITGGGRARKPIDIKIFGRDLNMLELLSQRIMERIKNIKGVFDVASSLEKGRPELMVELNREKALRSGLNLSHVARTVNTAVQGKVATRYRQLGEKIDVRVRFQEKDRDTIKDLEEINIPIMYGNAPGSSIALKEVAKIEKRVGPIRLTRENQKRTISVNANVVGRDLSGVLRDVKTAVEGILLPEGYFIEYAGEAKQMRDTFRDLGLIFILALIMIYMIMAAALESLIHPLIIMFTVPFSIVGVILAIFVTGKNISLPAGMGVLILSGVIVNNGIVLVDYINQLRRKGKEKIQAIIEAGTTRLRPVLMTATTTILGMLPLALSRSEGSEVRSVVAIAIIGGLTIGALLTLVVIPVLYTIIDDFGSKLTGKLRFLVRREK